MNFLVLVLLFSLAVVASVLLVQRQLLRGTRISSISLLVRLSRFTLYLFFAAIATALLSMVLLSGAGAFFDGFARIFTGSELFRADTSADVLASVTLVFITIAIGFNIVHRQAAKSRAFRRYLMGLPAAADTAPIPANAPLPKSDLDALDRPE
jgi:hypothetical protein